MSKKKLKVKKSFVVFIIVVILVIVLVGVFFVNTQIKNRKSEELIQQENLRKQKLLEKITSSYNKYVKTTKETKLYELKDKEYIEVGTIGKDVELTLKEIELTYETLYFLIDGLDLYISYKDVSKLENLTVKDQVYKKYVPFNQNVVTKSSTSFYNENGLVYEINKGVELPLLIKDTDKYYVEYDKQLLYIKKEQSSLKKHENTNEDTRTNIRTLTYHTIYDVGSEKCTNTVICHPIEQFDSHMKYLSENDYFTLRMKDLELFLEGKIRIPKKSIVITLDDGKYAQNAVDIVEKYKVYATYFIITSKYDVSNIQTTYMDFESHTHNLHNNWKCSGGNQGGQLLCEKEENILTDLKTSQDKLDGAISLAYPFFDFNERAIKLLKKSGFRLAFVGQYNTNGYASAKTDKFKIPRKTIFSYDSLDTFISYLK